MLEKLKDLFYKKTQLTFVSDTMGWTIQDTFGKAEHIVVQAVENMPDIHPHISGSAREIDQLRQMTVQINSKSAVIALAVKLDEGQDAHVFRQCTLNENHLAMELEILFPHSLERSRNTKDYTLRLDCKQLFAETEKNGNQITVQLAIMIFPRKKIQISSLEPIVHNIEAFKHELLKFNPHKNSFEAIGRSGIDYSARTLILIHGTFSSTQHSFRHIIGNTSDWLRQLTIKGVYGQILGFDHPTVIADARTNVAMLYHIIGNQKFAHATDFMGTSQGGLLCQYIANDRSIQTPFRDTGVGNVALINCANGVGYLAKADGVAKFFHSLIWADAVKQLRKESPIAPITNLTPDMLIQLPGLDLMKPGSARLCEILNQVPVRKNTRYYPIVSYFDSKTAQKKLRVFAKWFEPYIKQVLGNDNDWVVGTKEQYRVPKDYCDIKGYNRDNYADEMVSSIHGKSLAIPAVRDRLERFFSLERY